VAGPDELRATRVDRMVQSRGSSPATRGYRWIRPAMTGGYWLARADGSYAAFGDADFLGPVTAPSTNKVTAIESAH